MRKALTEVEAEKKALAAAKRSKNFVRCYVFRKGTRPGTGWGWCLDMSPIYIAVRKGGGLGDRRTLREVMQEGAPY